MKTQICKTPVENPRVKHKKLRKPKTSCEANKKSTPLFLKVDGERNTRSPNTKKTPQRQKQFAKPTKKHSAFFDSGWGVQGGRRKLFLKGKNVLAIPTVCQYYY
ncbi:MAG: hypothetical protein IJW08_10925, partial [Lentisphaeria bacterium]|nr:hypothetical protein [Lentisphaeria bacterium]